MAPPIETYGSAPEVVPTSELETVAQGWSHATYHAPVANDKKEGFQPRQMPTRRTGITCSRRTLLTIISIFLLAVVVLATCLGVFLSRKQWQDGTAATNTTLAQAPLSRLVGSSKHIISPICVWPNTVHFRGVRWPWRPPRLKQALSRRSKALSPHTWARLLRHHLDQLYAVSSAQLATSSSLISALDNLPSPELR